MSQLTRTVRPSPRWAWLVGLLVALAALALLWIGRASADARAPTARKSASASITFSAVPTPKADAAVHTVSSSCTCAPTYHPMPDMTKTFRLGGTASRSVIVMLTGEFAFGSGTGPAGYMRLVIDGRVQIPDEIVIASTGTGSTWETHGYNWISEALAPGTHTATVEWRDDGSAPYFALDTSMIILHK